MESTDPTDGGLHLEVRGAMNTQIVILRNKRASVKRRITNTIKKLNSSIEQFGRKAIIRGYVHILEECINEARVLNDRLVAVIPENEHEKALTWYEVELERVQEVKLEAKAHLEQRADESVSGLSSLKASKISSRSAHEIRAKVTSAEIKAKQLAMEEQRRKQEFEQQLKLKRKLEPVQYEAERVRFEAEERRKTQEAEDEAARLAAEAEILEKAANTVRYDHEPLSNRLLDFEDDSLEKIPSSTAEQCVVSQPPPGLVKQAQTSCETVLSTNNTSCTVTSSPSFQQPKFSIPFVGPLSKSRSYKVQGTRS